jgi:excisionase family DNA binding protein
MIVRDPERLALFDDIGGVEPKFQPPRFFTERTLAAYLAVSDRTIRNWIRRGELPSYKLGAARRIDPADVEETSSPDIGTRPRETAGAPLKRRYPSGEVVWLARYTGRDGRRRMAKPAWNGGRGTFDRKAEAQRAIDEAYGLSDRPDTLGDYAATWTERHPRSERTNATNDHRISRVADVEIEGIPLKDWPLRELRRRHALALVDHMLRTEGRATTGVVGILRSLSAMAEDAITDEVCDLNPFKGLRVRANDPRARKKPRPIRVFSFEEMHRFAKAAGRYEAMIRVFTDTGMRLGEVLPLRYEDFDGETLQVRRTAHEGVILDGTKTDHGQPDAGRIVPVPATLAWMLEAQINLNGSDCDLLFTTPTGRIWRERNFYRDLWKPTQKASGLDIRPHECRHSYVTHLRAAGVNDADLAEIAGHRVETMLARYTHAVGGRFEVVRKVIDDDTNRQAP